MQNVNIVIHLLAFIGYFYISYIMLTFKRQRDFLRKITTPQTKKTRLFFDSPEGFLKKFSTALNIKYLENINIHSKHQLIETRTILKVWAECGINHIYLTKNKTHQQNNNITIFILDTPPHSTDDLLLHLKNEIGLNVFFKKKHQ